MNKKLLSNIFILLLLICIVIADALMVKTKGGLIPDFSSSTPSINNPLLLPKLKEIKILEKSSTPLIIYEGESKQLRIADGATNEVLSTFEYNFISSNPSSFIVTTSGTLVSASKGTGLVKVVNKNDPNVYDFIDVEVRPKTNEILILNEEIPLRMIPNQVTKLDFTFGGSVSLDDIVMTSSKEECVRVVDGFMYALSNGISTVTISSKKNSSISDSIDIVVDDNLSTTIIPDDIIITSFYVNDKSVSITDAATLKYSVGDRIRIYSRSNSDTLKHVLFQSLSSNVKVLSLEEYVGEFVCTDPGFSTIRLSSKYDQSVYKDINFYVSKYNDESSLSLTSLELINNEAHLAPSTLIPLDVLIGDELLSLNDMIVTSSNTSVVRVVNGNLFTLLPGTSVINICYKGNSSLNISFTVNVVGSLDFKLSNVFIDNSYINGSSISIKKTTTTSINDVITFDVLLEPFDYDLKSDLVIESSNSDVLEVTSTFDHINNLYHVTALQKTDGDASLYIYTKDNLFLYKELKFTTKVYIPTTLECSLVTKNVFTVGDTYLASVIVDANKDYTVSYTSTNPDVVGIGIGGEIIAKSLGTSIIKAFITCDDLTKVVESVVTTNINRATYNRYEKMKYSLYTKSNNDYIPFDATTSALSVYQSLYLNITLNPNNYNTSNYIVSSSNPSVLDVHKDSTMYKLTASSSGSATITIKNYENDDLSTSFEVRVCEILPKYIISLMESNELKMNQYQKFDFKIDKNATYSKMDISYSKEGVVEVKDNYIVSLNPGTTTIIIKVLDETNPLNEYFMTIPIKVYSRDLGFTPYSLIDIIIYALSHLLVFLLIGIYLYQLVNSLKTSKIIRVSIIIVSGIILCILPELYKHSLSFSIVFITSCIINVASFTCCVLIYSFNILKKKVAGTTNE